MAKAESVSAYGFTPGRIVEKKMLNHASLEVNSNKFYYLEVQEDNANSMYQYRVYTKYGRVNAAKPTENARYFRSLYDAEDEYRSIIRSKTGRRSGSVYVEVELDDGLSPSTATVTTKAPVATAKSDKVVANDKVLQLINKLYKITTSYLVKTLDTPLGKLSATQVAKGAKVLAAVEEELKNGSNYSTLLRLTNEFYSIIPFEFGRKADINTLLIDHVDKVVDKRALLDVISSVVNVKSSLEEELNKKYDALNIRLTALTTTDPEYKRIESGIVKTHGKTHHFKMSVKNVYTVDSMTGHDKFNPKGIQTMELFHGTRKENVLGIMQKGILIKPRNAAHTGSMFGNGAYFANCSTKSAQYTDGFSNYRNEDQYMFVCEVATGNIKEYDDAQPSLCAAPRGYNSVKGCKGRSLRYDEFIVFNTNQVKITHIVEFQKV